jgi:hypothetical protein
MWRFGPPWGLDCVTKQRENCIIIQITIKYTNFNNRKYYQHIKVTLFVKKFPTLYGAWRILPMYTTLPQTAEPCSLTPYFFKIHFNTVLLPRSPKWSLPFQLSRKNLEYRCGGKEKNPCPSTESNPNHPACIHSH